MVSCAPMHNVTIVIPVHNSIDIACECVASCARSIDPRHTILVVDDGSEEPESRRLRELVDTLPNGRFARNEKAIGFVQSCNKAVLELDATENDILLLNSDTIVTEGFLEEMLACLYESERHAACSPRSDNATLCSIPLHRSRPFTARESETCWQQLKEYLPRYTLVPTGVGFCLLLRRDLIRRFGLFDEAYGLGYHEENDWCRRVNRMGFSTILSNRAFVFHKGTASFGSAVKKELSERNAHLLHERFPEYERLVQEYADRLLPAAEHFGEVIGKSETRPQVLIDLSHLSAAYNGTSEYVQYLLPRLIARHKDTWDLFVLVTKHGDEFFSFSSRFERVLHTEHLPPGKRFDLAFTPHQIFSLDHVLLLNRLAVKTVINVHDVIALRCGQLHTLDHEWAMRLMFKHADGIVSVSDDSLRDAKTYFGERIGNRQGLRTKTILHGFPETIPATDLPAAPFSDPFVLLVGNHFEHKAVQQAAAHIPHDMPAVILGGKQVPGPQGNHLVLRSGNLSEHQMHSLYAQCAVVLFPSQYEGFGMPLLHAAANGKPIIVCETDVNRSIARRMGIELNLLPFRSFAEIPLLLTRAMNAAPIPLPVHTRGWDDAAAETALFLQEILAMPLNSTALEERFSSLMMLEHVRVDAQNRRGLNIVRRMHQQTASFVGRSLKQYPLLKRRLALVAAFFRLLP